MSIRPSLLLTAALLAAIRTAHADTGYTLSVLDNLAGSTQAFALNNAGQVAGWTQTANNLQQHAFLYSAGITTDLGTLGGSASLAWALNNNSQTAGWAITLNDAAQYAYLNTAASMSSLGTLGGAFSEARALNDSGQVVGWADNADGNPHAVLYSAGNKTDLGTLGGDTSTAYAINASAQIAGTADTLTGDQHAFLYASGTISDLGTFGGLNSNALAINNAGRIVGNAQFVNGAYHAFLYNGTLNDLGSLGGPNSYATSINNNGQIVGYAQTGQTVNNFLITHAFLSDGATITDLNSLLPANSGWTLTSAAAINDSGQILAQGSFGSTGLSHPLLLTPIAIGAVWNSLPGNWSDPLHWTSNPSFPNNNSPSGALYDVFISASTVTLDVSAAVRSLNLSGGTLTGPGNLTFANATILGACNLSGTTILSGGTLFFAQGAQSTAAITGAGSLFINQGVTLTAGAITLNQLSINGALIIRPNLGNAGTSKLSSLAIVAAADTFLGKCDLTDNKLILQSSDAADKSAKISALNIAITAGSNLATWTGAGLTSSTAAADPAHYGLGLFDNALLQKTSFGGQPVDSNSILTSIAHLGDANANGIVDIQDLTIIANHWQQPASNWAAGDLNRDGVVDIQDFTIVANNWQQSSAFPLYPAPYTLSPASVPEPASLALLSLSAFLLPKRRKRRAP